MGSGLFPGIEIGQQRPSRRAATANAAPTSIILLPQKPSHLSSDLFSTKDRCRHLVPLCNVNTKYWSFSEPGPCLTRFRLSQPPRLILPVPKSSRVPQLNEPPYQLHAIPDQPSQGVYYVPGAPPFAASLVRSPCHPSAASNPRYSVGPLSACNQDSLIEHN